VRGDKPRTARAGLRWRGGAPYRLVEKLVRESGTMAEPQSRRAVEQSFAAVRELVLGLGALHERLDGACDALLVLESPDLPPALRDEFKALVAAIDDIDEMATLSDDDAAALAMRILLLHERLIVSTSIERAP